MTRGECQMEDCQRPHYGRGYCRTHWTRWRRHGDPTITLRSRSRLCEIPGCERPHYGHGLCRRHCYRHRRGPNTQRRVVHRAPACTVEECGRRHYLRGYCRTHYARCQRDGDPRPEVPIGIKTRGGVSYWSVHQRVRSERGPASELACAECGAAARDWSYDGADPNERTDPARGYRYSLDLTRYRPRCRSCHRKATIAARGDPELDVERAARLYRAGATSRGIGALLGASPRAVRAALRAYGVEIRPPGRRRR